MTFSNNQCQGMLRWLVIMLLVICFDNKLNAYLLKGWSCFNYFEFWDPFCFFITSLCFGTTVQHIFNDWCYFRILVRICLRITGQTCSLSLVWSYLDHVAKIGRSGENGQLVNRDRASTDSFEISWRSAQKVFVNWLT